MKRLFRPDHFLYLILLTVSANSFLWLKQDLRVLLFVIPAVLAVHIFPGMFIKNIPEERLRVCYHGASLLVIFLTATVFSVIFHVILAVRCFPSDIWTWIWSALLCTAIQASVFWNGIITVYCTSKQLGFRFRALGLLCGMIPILNLIALGIILQVVLYEIDLESDKAILNEKRKAERLCATKYPILMVHGVFFRDSEKMNYWGRIPAELEKNGATIFYGEHESASSVADSAWELALRIKQITIETGCEKVNVIAHSKGGLDMRYALSHTDIAPFVASLTTVNTPHRGCIFVDYLLEKAPKSLAESVAATYNGSFKILGDKKPDFMAAVSDLTASACRKFNEEVQMPDSIYCQSIGSRLNYAVNGRFPLNVSYPLVRYFDGANDGLVAEESFPFGEKYTLLTVKGKRGISHADMIDLMRENIRDFDVREFFVQTVAELKQKGL
ncbi:MAG: triacylglycerol lipase [Clostridia bacterium]|nr:triacylglycerol lipase [Clostridia bacterium]